MLVFGEDVGRKGGVYGADPRACSSASARRGCSTRCSTSSRSSASALGFGVSGLLPVPEIQYLAYLHNAEDQLRGEAASLRFFSNGTFTNPMVVRVAGLGYQKGFGGHFHNDNAVGRAARHPRPRRRRAVAARGRRRRCCARAWPRRPRDGQVSVFLEPIALYHERDLHEPRRPRLARRRTRPTGTRRSARRACTATAPT